MAAALPAPKSHQPSVSFDFTVVWQSRCADGDLIACAVGFHSQENARRFFSRVSQQPKVLLRGDWTRQREGWDEAAVIESQA